jgi:hypothetical protein
MDSLKAKLGSAVWRKWKDVAVEVDGELFPVVIRKAPPGVAVLVLDEARKAGDLNAENEAANELAGLRLLARMVATVLFAQGAVRPLFDRNNPEDLATVQTAPWLMDLRDDCVAALGATGAALEKLKGNSEATPTGQ